MAGTEKKIKVNYYPHIFSTDRKTTYTNKQTAGEILSELGLQFTKDIVFIDKDKKIYGNNTKIQNDEVHVRIFPTGTGNTNQDIGTGEKIAGGLAIIAGIAITIASTGTLTPLAALLIGTGVSLFIGGVVLFNTQIPELPEFKDTNSLPSVRGSKNKTRHNGRIPILLGRHRVFPDVAAAPYVNTDVNSVQTLYQIFCAGLSNMSIDESTIKVGETDFNADAAGQSQTYTQAYYNIKYGEASAFTYYEGRRIDTSYGDQLFNKVDDLTDGPIPITKTTPTNTRKFTVRIGFPRGLIKYDSDGDAKTASVGVRVEYKPTGTDDSNYTIIAADTSEATPTVKFTPTYLSGNNYFSFSSGTYFNKIFAGDVVTGPDLPGGTTVTEKRKIQTGYYPASYTFYIYLSNSFTGSGSGQFTFTPAGSYNPTYTTITNNTTQTYRKLFTYTLDNLTPAGADYTAARQYDIRVTRITRQRDSTKIIDDCYLEAIKTDNGVFDNAGSYDDSPISSAIQDKLTLFELKIQSSNQLKNIIDQINFVATVKAPTYSGSGSGAAQWTTLAATRNPASMFLMCLQNEYINQHPVADAKIDWESLEAWYTFCASKNFYCDAFLNTDFILSELLTYICSTGRASWNIVNGTYKIIIDTTKSDVIQMFTPRNTFNYVGNRAFLDAPTALKMSFINADNGYVAEERTVYKDDLSPDDTYTQSVQLFGVTDPDQVWRLGKYQLAVAELRPEIHKFDTDIEHIVCTRGDRVYFQHDVPLIGIRSGRVVSAIESGGNTLGFVVDEYFPVTTGTTYSVRFRFDDGTYLEKEIVNPGTGEYTSFTFSTPETGTGVIVADDLVDFGESGSIDLDLIVLEIQPKAQEQATLTCVEYAPGIFTADSGAIPDYEPQISAPGSGDGGINVTNIPDTDSAIATVSEDTSSAYETLTARYPDSFISNDATSYYYAQDDDYTYYVNYDDGGKIYKKQKDKVTDGEAITTVSSGPLAYHNGYLIYINMDDGMTMYRKSVDDALTGDQLTTEMSWSPSIDPEDGTVYYINRDDSDEIYTTFYLNDTTTGNSFLAVNAVWCSAGYGQVLYMTPTGLIQAYNINTTGTTAITTDICGNFSVLDDDELVFTKITDGTAYSRLMDGTGNETALFLFADYVNGYEGNLVYSSTISESQIAAALSNRVVPVSVLEASTEYSTISGSITTSSNLVVDVDPLDMDRLARGDFLIAPGIPNTAQVTLLGPNYFYMSQNATATTTDVNIQVNGSRIFLNANKIISKGTIEAPLLTASAIDSKARTSLGTKKMEANLDDGTFIWRKDSGAEVLNFDADRAGSELQINGTVTLGSGSTGVANLSDAGDLATEDHDNVDLESSNYISGTSGWQLTAAGNFEGNNGTFRGTVTAGDVQSTNFSAGSAGYKLDGSAGSAEFSDLYIRGDSQFDGAILGNANSTDITVLAPISPTWIDVTDWMWEGVYEVTAYTRQSLVSGPSDSQSVTDFVKFFLTVGLTRTSGSVTGIPYEAATEVVSTGYSSGDWQWVTSTSNGIKLQRMEKQTITTSLGWTCFTNVITLTNNL